MDALTILSTTARSQISRLFKCSLWHKHNRLDPNEFNRYLRLYTGLPQPLKASGRARQMANSDIVAEPCLDHDHEECLLDHVGAHAGGCFSTRAARARNHWCLVATWAQLGREAHMLTEWEPSTENLLNNQYSAVDIRKMFPKKLGDGAGKAAAHLRTVITQIENCKNAAAKAVLLQQATKMLEETSGDRKGLRLDLRLTLRSGDEIVLDQSTVRSSTKAYLTDNVKFLVKEARAEQKTARHGGSNPFEGVSTPAVVACVKHKHAKYAPLMDVMRLQKQKKRRTAVPMLLIPVVSQLGEFSEDTFKLIEIMAREVKRAARDDPYRTMRPQDAAARFRTRAKDAIAVAVARGFARELTAAGLPSLSRGSDFHD